MLRGTVAMPKSGQSLSDYLLQAFIHTVVRIDLMTCDGRSCQKRGHGTGYLYLDPQAGKVRCMTVFHVADPQYTIQARLWDGRTFPLKFEIGSADRDMAIAGIDGDGDVMCVPNLILSEADHAQMGQAAFTLGNPQSAEFSYAGFNVGNMVKTKWPGQEVPCWLLETDGRILGGNSGGPIVILPNGPHDLSQIRTGGSVSFGYPSAPGLNYSVSTSHYAAMLDTLNATPDNQLLGSAMIGDVLYFDSPMGIMVHSATRGSPLRKRVVPAMARTNRLANGIEQLRRWTEPREIRRELDQRRPVRKFEIELQRKPSVLHSVTVGTKTTPVATLYELKQRITEGTSSSNAVVVGLNFTPGASGDNFTHHIAVPHAFIA